MTMDWRRNYKENFCDASALRLIDLQDDASQGSQDAPGEPPPMRGFGLVPSDLVYRNADDKPPVPSTADTSIDPYLDRGNALN